MVKKILFGSFAVLAAMTLTTSCTNDDVFDSSKDINVAKYEAMFIQKFGQPSPTQTWGFEDAAMTRAKSDYAGIRGTMTANYTFPEDCAASKFVTAVPEGVNKFPAGGDSSSGTFFIDATTTRVNMYNGAGVIYVKGTCDLSADNCFEIPQNTEIYLIKDATLKLGYNDANKLKAIIYIHPDAKLETADRLKMDNTSKVYNHGLIEVGAFEVNNTSFLYNVGTLKTTGLIYIANNGSSIVNDGIIEGGSIEVAGSGHFQNNAETTLTGNTVINSNNLTWINNGLYETENFTYTAGSNDVINNCQLKVRELFRMNLGSVWPQNREYTINQGFRMDGGSSVVTKDFSLESCAFINMGPASLFKVTRTANMNITQAVYGIYGPATGDYAVFQAKDITCDNPRQRFNVSYYDHLYVVSDTHFQFGYDDLAESEWATKKGNGPFYYIGEGVHIYTNGEMPNYTIAKTNCNPGFGGDDDEFTPNIRVMAEDLTVTDASKDFDFNDIVFDVMWTATGAKLRLNAAGGTLPLTVGGTTGPDGIEVHAAFAEVNPGRNITTKTMMNTAAGNKESYTRPIITLVGNFKNAQGENNANLIKIFVNKGTENDPSWVEIKAETGKVAAKFGCDPKTEWCDERQDIETRYSFGAWARGERSFFQ
jgi:hypothetical protein